MDLLKAKANEVSFLFFQGSAIKLNEEQFLSVHYIKLLTPFYPLFCDRAHFTAKGPTLVFYSF